MRTHRSRQHLLVSGLLLLLLIGRPCLSATIPVFQTGFETEEGYNADFDLEGQQGWLGTSDYHESDNGLISDYFPGLGQHAYIGFSGEGIGEDAVYVWHPLEIIPPQFPIAHFSVTMLIEDSLEVTKRDYFDWTVFNPNEEQLFTLEFDNNDLGIYYALENGTNFIWTGAVFERSTAYNLTIDMDFSRNRWSAALDGNPIVNEKVITQFGSTLELADVDAVWIYRDPNAPGDNFMVFDNYSITASSIDRPYLTNLTQLANGTALFRVVGEVGRRYAVEVTTDFSEWSILSTNTADNGFFDYVDETAVDYPTSFYRARLAP